MFGVQEEAVNKMSGDENQAVFPGSLRRAITKGTSGRGRSSA
jgi:hypothetical protein